MTRGIFYDKVDKSFVKKAKFVFLIHARDLNDFWNNYPLARGLSREDLLNLIKKTPPKIIGKISNSECNGIVLGIFFNPDLSLRGIKSARKKIREAVLYAKELGIRYVGLGGLSASLSHYGRDLIDIPGMILTTGHIMAPWALEKSVEKVSYELELSDPVVSIVGAMGSVGCLLSRRLSDLGYKLLLIDLPTKREMLKEFSERYRIGEISTNIADITKSDIIVSVTSNIERLIDINSVRSNSILIDDAQPWCWDHYKGYERFRSRMDILPLEGGFLTTRDGSITQDNIAGNSDERDFFCCAGEVFLLSKYFPDLEPVVGKNDLTNLESRLDSFRKYEEAALEEGFIVSDWQCGPHIYTAEEIEKFKMYQRNLVS